MIDPAVQSVFPGCRVTYDRTGEPGIVKAVEGHVAFVVYNCGGDWENFENYTAARTNLWDLSFGWSGGWKIPAKGTRMEAPPVIDPESVNAENIADD